MVGPVRIDIDRKSWISIPYTTYLLTGGVPVQRHGVASSGVARLGHTGARALATAPPAVQVRNRIIGDRKSGAKRF